MGLYRRLCSKLATFPNPLLVPNVAETVLCVPRDRPGRPSCLSYLYILCAVESMPMEREDFRAEEGSRERERYACANVNRPGVPAAQVGGGQTGGKGAISNLAQLCQQILPNLEASCPVC